MLSPGPRLKETSLYETRGGSKLPHLLEVHGFFVTLIKCCNKSPGHRLVRWWSEGRCALEWSYNDGRPIIRPDGQGILRGPSESCSFILELDRGTERGTRLTDKSNRYVRVARYNRRSKDQGDKLEIDAVLYLFPSARRELSARDRLVAWDGLPVVTGHRELHERDPLGRNWSPIHWSDPQTRLNLYELGALHEERHHKLS